MLWNVVYKYYIQKLETKYYEKGSDDEAYRSFIQRVWSDAVNFELDKLGNDYDILNTLKNYFFKCEWYEVYDFIEFLPNNYYSSALSKNFRAL